MRARKFPLAAMLPIAAVLVLAAALLVSRGPVEALLMIALVAVLDRMYMLRRYARAKLLYHRDPSRQTTGDKRGTP